MIFKHFEGFLRDLGGARGANLASISFQFSPCWLPPGPSGLILRIFLAAIQITSFIQQPKKHINIRFLSKILEDFLVNSL